jgi:hypothetical protein
MPPCSENPAYCATLLLGPSSRAGTGYEDASFFGRLFRRKVGLTPAQYRKRFRSLREALPQR